MKYILAYTGPLTMVPALYFQGLWSWLPLVFLFVILPVTEWMIKPDDRNLIKIDAAFLESKKFFDILLYVNVLIVWCILFYYSIVVVGTSLQTFEYLGLTIGMGIVLGSFGINVAHELGHRTDFFSRFMAGALLLPALFMRFTIEHNYGHHKYVATEKDPASAERGINIYHFIFRSFLGTYKGAFLIEKRRLERDGKNKFLVNNKILHYELIQISYLLIMGLILGWKVIPFLVAAALIAITLLEAVNYIEHYGLRRKKLAAGRYEAVDHQHSWNSSHVMSRIFLYELNRHPDHHQRADKKYQILEHESESPQLPYGYPHMIILALFPALFYKTIHPVLDSYFSIEPH